MRNHLHKEVWIVERLSDGHIICACTSKCKLLDEIYRWKNEGQYDPIDLGEQMPMDNLPCFVKVASTVDGRTESLFIHKVALDTGAGMMFVFKPKG